MDVPSVMLLLLCLLITAAIALLFFVVPLDYYCPREAVNGDIVFGGRTGQIGIVLLVGREE